MGNYLSSERETIIRFADDSDIAYVNTFNRSFQRKLEMLLADNPEQVKLVNDYAKDNYDGIYVTMPKSWIKIRTPKKLSDETRAAMSDRMKNARINSTL